MRTRLKFDLGKLLTYEEPGDVPNYSIAEVSRYLGIPPATLNSWVFGREYPTIAGKKFFEPVIQIPDKDAALLSFANFVEVHILNAFRRQYDIRLAEIRNAVDFLSDRVPSRHPLLDVQFETDGKSLFVRELGKLIDVGRRGQLSMQQILDAHLRRIDRDESGTVFRLYPFLDRGKFSGPKVVFVDPNVCFGRPVLAGTGVSTTILASRFRAGDTNIDELAKDYGIEPAKVRQAIRWELSSRAA